MPITIRPFHYEQDRANVQRCNLALELYHSRLWMEITGEPHDAGYWEKLLATPEAANDYDQELQTAHTDENKQILIAETAAGEFAGFLYIEVRNTPRHGVLEGGCINEIFVEPAFRGQRVAHLLMQAGEDWFASKGLSRGQVFVTANNPAAVKLYESFGYVIADYRMLKKHRDA
ncbi:GNAT family N-acetyltransferase [Brevibacillus dissolubilis]|uniref:GNAT family N-acetyltransferase n=1 Tax=Brevibacillus dissolubilis TaxID=1844116 RepID=UPI00111690E3|nr:GNAT family N-acetyltransferase [Brevibacillus dissolubilis]